MTDSRNESGRTLDLGAPEHFSQTRTGHLQSSTQDDNATHTAPQVPSLGLEALHRHHRAGHELIPLHSPDDQDARGRHKGKAPLHHGWRTAAALTLSDAKAHLASGRNVGVRLRAEDLVIDADPRNYPPGVDPLRQMIADFRLPDCPTVETGGGGYHLYMRKPAGISVAGTLAAYPGVEFKTLSRQVVAAGSIHPETRRPYAWDPLSDDPARAPVAPDDFLAAIEKRAPVEAAAEAGIVTPEQLAAMLAGLSATKYGTNDLWLPIAMGAHHGTAGLAEDEFVAWCETDPLFADRGEEVRKRWASFSWQRSSNPVTIRTLYKVLTEEGRIDLIPKATAEEDFADEPVEISHLAATVASDRDLIDRMNEQYCAVMGGNGFEIYKEDTDGTYDPPRPVWTSMSRASFLHWHENTRVKVMGSRRELTEAEFWLQSPRRRQYPGIVLDPEGREPKKLNLWKGWAVTPKAGRWSYLQELTESVLCAGNSDHAAYVFKWMAFMLQKPSQSPEVAITFRGGEGVGKGTLGRMLLGIAGTHGLTVSSPSQFAGRFNAHLRTVAFLFADEAFVPGNKECEGILKQLLTEPVIAYEGKGANIVPGRNLVHLMMASNNDWIAPASVDARRFAVFDVTDARKGDRGFFGKLKQQMEREGGYAAMLHDLFSMNLGDWHPSVDIPKTQALADQKIHSLDAPTLFWKSLLERGTLPTTSLLDWTGDALVIDAISKQEVIDEYDRFLKAGRHYSRRATAKALVGAGKTFGLDTVNKDGSERQWTLPPLREARRRFERSLGSSDMFNY